MKNIEIIVSFIINLGLNNAQIAALFNFFWKEGDEDFDYAEFHICPDGSLLEYAYRVNGSRDELVIDLKGDVYFKLDGYDYQFIGSIYAEANALDNSCYVLPDIGEYNDIYIRNAGLNVAMSDVAITGNIASWYDWDTLFEYNLLNGESRHKGTEAGCFWTEWQ